MKKLILPLLAGTLFIASCNKDDDKPKEVVQIQQIEVEGGKISFSYNDDNQVSKLEVSYNSIPVGYVNIMYENGLPAFADSYHKESLNEEFKREASFKFSHNGKNIGYSAAIYYNADGTPDESSRDTVFFNYNSSNQVVSVRDGSNSEASLVGWDNRNNLLLLATTDNYGNYKSTTTYEHSYDNNVNPFSFGLGAILMALDYYEVDGPDQILSANNSLSLKSTVKTERFENGQLQGTSYYYQTITRNFTMDENGLPKTCKTIRKTKNVQEGGTENENTEETTMVYTCVKKQL